MKNSTTQQAVTTLKNVHGALLSTMDGVTNEIAAYQPEGKANPIAGTFAHLVLGEDMFCNIFLKNGKPLSETSWKDKTGFSSSHPTEWTTEYPKWLREVKMDVEQAMKYTKAVFEDTENYVATLSDEDFEKPVDMSSFGMEKATVGTIIFDMIIGHAASIMGEISVLKGIQGLKGYPF